MESLGLDWIVNIKNNQSSLLAEADRLTAGPPQHHEANPQQDLQLWHVPEVDWPVDDRAVRVVKTVRVQNAKCDKIEERQVEAPRIEEPKAEKAKGRNSKRRKPKCSRVKRESPIPLSAPTFILESGSSTAAHRIKSLKYLRISTTPQVTVQAPSQAFAEVGFARIANSKRLPSR